MCSLLSLLNIFIKSCFDQRLQLPRQTYTDIDPYHAVRWEVDPVDLGACIAHYGDWPVALNKFRG
jgi:hypothetical protein